MVKCWDCN